MQPIVISKTERWLVLAKPPGWLSVPPSPGSPIERPVLTQWARSEHGSVFAVHRLDLETSGVILLARTEEAHRLASGWFESRKAVKGYQFLASGNLAFPMLNQRAPIRGVPAATQFEQLERFEGAFLGAARPLTGRRHQIRIHAQLSGHPLLGDPAYGGTHATLEGELRVSRVALHARSLEIPGGERFEAEWPADFASWVEALRKGCSLA